jgi:hypothetical protein
MPQSETLRGILGFPRRFVKADDILQPCQVRNRRYRHAVRLS